MNDNTKGLRTWVEIDRGNVLQNLKSIKNKIKSGVKIMAVVKSNAYGHGLWDFSKILDNNKNINWFGVDSVVEALSLRKKGVKKPILVMGYTLPEMYSLAIKNDISLTVSSFDFFDNLSKMKFNKKIRAHIKVDTGMHRHGFYIKDIDRVINLLSDNLDKIEIEGVFTHLADAKDPKDQTFTNFQISEFKKWNNLFTKKLKIKPIRHVLASGGCMINKNQFDMVRLGICLYGIWPSKLIYNKLKDQIILRPVLRWKTVVAEIKNVKRGEGVGYGLSQKFKTDKTIAILPVGYWHGFSRSFSKKGKVLINGVVCGVVGIVCMDIIMVDVSFVKNIKTGDVVEIFGSERKSENCVENQADLIDNSPYELVTRINPLIKRLVV